MYWLFLWKNFNAHLCATATGTKILHTAPNRIEDYTFSLPPIDEQKEIASTLCALDNKTRLNIAMNTLLEAVGQALFKRWFVDFEFPNQEGKPYKSSGGKMVDNNELNQEIPESWTVKDIGDLTKINEKTINNAFELSEIEYIDIDSVEQGTIKKHQILRLADAPSRAKRIVSNNDTIISTVRPNLKHYALVQSAKRNTIVSTGFAVITPFRVYSKFLYFHLTADKFTNYLSAIADSHTSTYPSFNPDVIQKSKVACPEKESKLPMMFESMMEKLFCKIENNNQQVSTLSQIRDLLLPKLMSGKIRVPINNETWRLLDV